MFEDFKKKEKKKIYICKIFLLSPPSIYVSVMKYTTRMDMCNNK